jgi:hypothetical protein
MDAAGRDGAVATPARVTAPTKNADIASRLDVTRAM